MRGSSKLKSAQNSSSSRPADHCHLLDAAIGQRQTHAAPKLMQAKGPYPCLMPTSVYTMSAQMPSTTSQHRPQPAGQMYLACKCQLRHAQSMASPMGGSKWVSAAHRSTGSSASGLTVRAELLLGRDWKLVVGDGKLIPEVANPVEGSWWPFRLMSKAVLLPTGMGVLLAEKECLLGRRCRARPGKLGDAEEDLTTSAKKAPSSWGHDCWSDGRLRELSSRCGAEAHEEKPVAVAAARCHSQDPKTGCASDEEDCLLETDAA